MKPANHLLLLRMVLIASATIFMVEFGIRATVTILFPSIANWTQALLDSTALVLFLLPILYISFWDPTLKFLIPHAVNNRLLHDLIPSIR
jgi:hypothetical protein